LLKSGRVLLGNGLKLPGHSELPADGGIYVVDLSDPAKMPSAAKMKLIPSSEFAKENFHPAGISTYEEANGRILLYAASLHAQQVDAFEVSIAEKTIKHLRVIRDPLFHGVNDLILVSPKSFYVTNCMRFTSPMVLQFAELIFKLPLGSVVFYDGKVAKEVLTGLKGPNGIALSPDKKQLYLALHMAEEFQIYDIESDFSLKLRQTFHLYTGVDNLNVDDAGAIWIGAHPILYQLFQYLQDPEKNLAPSQILKISFDKKNSENPEITEIYADSGKTLKGSTAAVRYKDRLLIGSVFDKLLLCELKCY